MNRLRIGMLLAAMIGLAPSSPAQTVPGEQVTLQQVRQLRLETEASEDLPEEVRVQVLEVLEAAIGKLLQADDNRAAARGFERDRAGIDRKVAALRAELEKPESAPQVPRSASRTVARAEDALARERSRLAANRAALRNQQRLAEDRAAARSEVSQRLGELDLVLELVDDELRQHADSTARIELKTATRLSILARRQAAVSEIEMLRARLDLLSERTVLTPLEVDLAQRRVSHLEELVGLLEKAAHELRVESARESLGQVREQARELVEQAPSLQALAAETVELAELLWAEAGVVNQTEQTVQDLDATRNHQAQLNRIIELTSRKFEAYGHRGSVARWWPDVPEDFPEPGTVAATIQYLDEEIPEVEHALIVYEQKRSRARALARTTMLQLQEELGDELDPELGLRVRELLARRQDLLDELIRRGGRYETLLIEYRAIQSSFLAKVREVERFLYSRMLWARSVPKPVVPRARDAVAAARWLTSSDQLRSASVLRVGVVGGGWLLAALLLATVVLLRQPMRRRMQRIAVSVADPRRDRLGLTLAALVLTILRAAPLPLALFFASVVCGRVADSTYWFSASRALHELAMVAALIEAVRHLFAPDGLAEAHFKWPTHATRPLYRGLLLVSAISLPLLGVALHLAFAGMALDSPERLQLYNNSLGRIAFVLSLMVLGLSIVSMLRPERREQPSEQEVRVPWPQRFSEYAFPTAFLGAYPIIVLTTLVPAVLAAFGFYVTAVLLAYQMQRSLLLALAVMVGGGLVHRWRVVNRNRALREAADQPDEQQRLQDLEAAESQVRQLLRFAVIGTLAVGLLSIWSDAVPMLEALQRVQLLPRVELLEPDEDPVEMLSPRVQADEPDTAAAGTADMAPMPGVPAAPADAAVAADEPARLTLWNLLEAILVAVFTLILVRNLPGVIEIVLQRRTGLDSGARFAFSTLVRYSITIFGTIAVFGLLGVSWSKVQWLAAALTFGLGFGLQEIVANFVSGLILLVERPVRVGDVVTIGNLMGKVTRIQIRATTITLWDRSEMIVPNKEFITTKLVNWTLSDAKRRIEVPLRIAYGTDLDRVRTLLIDAAAAHPSVLEDPAPHVLLIGFGDDAINFELRFVVDFGHGLTTKDEVQMAIDRAFREHGIEFALPRSEVRFVSEGGPAPEAAG
jgi:potassium efflux system protein